MRVSNGTFCSLLMLIHICSISVKTAIDPIEICTTLTASLRGNGLLKKDNLGRTLLHWSAYRGAGTCCMHLIQVTCGIGSYILHLIFTARVAKRVKVMFLHASVILSTTGGRVCIFRQTRPRRKRTREYSQ